MTLILKTQRQKLESGLVKILKMLTTYITLLPEINTIKKTNVIKNLKLDKEFNCQRDN